MTPETAAWLSELWPTCRELPIDERIAKREADAVAQALLAAQAGESDAGTVEELAS